MTRLYKLTDQDSCTYGSTLWGPGITHRAFDVENPKLCTNTVIHAYTDPYLAIIMNAVHAHIKHPKLWIAEGEVVVSDGLMVGCRSLTTIEEIDLPEVSIAARIRYAIYCALAVYHNDTYGEWAKKWLSGEDRSPVAATAAAATAYASSAYAANAAIAAANAAVNASYANAASTVAYTTAAAANTARAAANAANAAGCDVSSIDFVGLLHKAIKDEDVSI